MKKLSLYLSILFLMSCATNIPSTIIPTIQETQSDITIDDFKAHITYLSSDGLAGRSSGTPGDRLAKDYIVNHFTNTGGSAFIFHLHHAYHAIKNNICNKIYNITNYIIYNNDYFLINF